MVTNKMAEDFIQTYSGRAFHFGSPKVEEIDIEDIAHALSLLCRFGGHCTEFYSVAEHSVRCAQAASKEYKLEALLHDAGEAYVVDIPRPIKYTLKGYKELENSIESVIRKKFNLPIEMTKEVKHLDNVMLATEKRDLMLPSEIEWFPLPDPLKDKIEPMSPKEAKIAFINMFKELTKEDTNDQ